MMLRKGAQAHPIEFTSDLRELLDKYCRERWSGAVQVEFASGDWQVILVAGEMLKCAYRSVSDRIQKVNAGEERILPTQTIKHVVSYSMPASSLRLMKIQLEQPAPDETLTVQTERLSILATQWTKEATPNLGVLRWPEADGFFIVASGRIFTDETAFFSQSGQAFGSEAVVKQQAWNEPTLNISRFIYTEEIQAWVEFSVHAAFVTLLEQVLLHYKDLTGLALLNALGRNINRVAMEHKCVISVTLGKLSDQTIFPNLDEAIRAYNAILAVSFEHIAIVLGPKLMRQAIHDSIGALEPRLAKIVTKFTAVEDFIMSEPGRIQE